MLVLDATTKSITVAMSAAAATTNPDFVSTWADNNGASFTEGSSDGALNGTSQVTLVAAPASSTRRIINGIFIENKDTAAVTLTITYNDNSTLRNIAKVTLQVGDTWTTNGTFDSTGALKQATNAGVSSFSAGTTGFSPSSATTGAITLTGTLAVTNGGTGLTTLTANYVPYGNGTGSYSSSGNFQYDGTTMRVGATSLLGGTTNPIAGFTGASSNYIQAYIYNSTNDASSSADFVAYPNNGADAHGWVDVGITSQTYADATYTVTGPNESYVFASAPTGSSTTGNLVYATDSTGTANSHQWYVGGFTQSKSAWKMQLTSTGLQLATALSPAYGGTGVANNASSTITITGAYGITFTVGATTALTLPSSGTVATLAGTETFTNKTLTNPTITNYTESVVAIGTVTTASTIALTSGTIQTATLTASTGCTFTMPTATAGKSFTLLLKQAASTGNGTATFTGVKWGTAGAPTITATAGKMDILTFVSDGTNWYGNIAQGYTP